ncbi:unnamed protein product [Rodentolepis nana]|uniref:PP1-binding domain-containing protein n=1 Tax=Rodentolepis nana TaxID=102285 RepID=A0A158QIY4_RODNA|nr:unnamed protein product [Rodentolepis nana]
MQPESALDVNGCSPNSSEKVVNGVGNSSKFANHSDPKPKMNIALDGSTYTKTIDLNPQDFYKLSSFDDFGDDFNQSYPQTSSTLNGQVSHLHSEPIEPTINPSALSKKNTSFSISPSCGKLRGASRSTFFSRLARRLTIRRSNSKPPTTLIPSSSSNDANSTKPPQVPKSRKIRRWFSKHMIPPYKHTFNKSSPEAFTARAATFDGTIDERVSQPTEDFGSVPIRRRGFPPPNLSETSLCNSQVGTLSLNDDPFEANESACLHQGARSYEKERLVSACASDSIPNKTDNHATQLSSAFSSPSVTAFG